MRLGTAVFALCASLHSVGAVAESPWGGKIAVGAIAASGNSETSTFNFEFGLSYDKEVWHNALKASAMQARSETEDDAGNIEKRTTSERYVVGMRSALDFTDNDYLFLQLDFEKDLFGGVRERTAQTLGYGRRVINGESHKLDLELGAGARQTLAQEDGARRESEVVGRAGLIYAWQISETSRFAQTLTTEYGDTNTYTESLSELKLSVIGGVFANLAFTVKHNSNVPADTEQTDTISSVSLSYEY